MHCVHLVGLASVTRELRDITEIMPLHPALILHTVRYSFSNKEVRLCMVKHVLKL